VVRQVCWVDRLYRAALREREQRGTEGKESGVVLHRTSSMSSLAFIFLILEAPTAADRALEMQRIVLVSWQASAKFM
jgi:hypothetical protein